MSLSRRVFAAWILVVALPALAAADDYTNRVGIALGGGAYKLAGGGKDFTRVGPWAQVGLRWGWLRNWDVEANYRYGQNWDTSQNFRTTTTGVDLGVLWSHNPDAKWSLQGFGGTGVFWFNVVDFRGAPSPGIFTSGRDAMGFREDGNGAALNGNNFKTYAGFSAEYFLTERLSVRPTIRLDYLIKQYIDNSGASDSLGAYADSTGLLLPKAKANVDANDLVAAFAVTFTWFFGERDADQDGIPNRSDGCPYEAEDKDGTADEDGCPDADDDGDKVPDIGDKCPGTPVGVVVDSTGCPQDGDADGVPDGPDQCADTPTGAKVDAAGCPTDADQDGVPDGIDTCEGTPRGIPIDATGCPNVLKIDKERILGTVSFEGATAKLTPGSFGVLDSLAVSMRAFPGVDLEVQGHVAPNTSKTRNPGQVKANDQKLSQSRAEAVVQYMATKGVDATRFVPIGYGSEKPPEGDLATGDRASRIVIAPMQAPAVEPVEPVEPKKD